MRPDALGVRRRLLHDRGAADARLIAADHREDFHAADVRALEPPLGRPDIGQLAALAGRHDQQFEMLGAERIDVAGQRPGDVHLRASEPDRGERIGDRLVGDAREPAQKLDLLARLDLAQAREDRFARGEPRLRQRLEQARHVAGRQVIHFDRDLGARKPHLVEHAREHRHGIVGELGPDVGRRRRLAGADRGRLHVDAENAGAPIGGHHHHGVAMTHQRLRRHHEARRIGEVLRRTGDERIEARRLHGGHLPVDDVLAHGRLGLSLPPPLAGPLPYPPPLAGSRLRGRVRVGVFTRYFSTFASSTAMPMPGSAGSSMAPSMSFMPRTSKSSL